MNLARNAALHSDPERFALMYRLLWRLQANPGMMEDKADDDVRRIEELDKQIELMEKNILAQRKKMGGVNAAKENHTQIAKQIKILENRLEKALQKFNDFSCGSTDHVALIWKRKP